MGKRVVLLKGKVAPKKRSVFGEFYYKLECARMPARQHSRKGLQLVALQTISLFEGFLLFN